VDELQDRLVRIGLNILADYGFALAGGYALQAYHLVERLSEDVDLFTDRWDPSEFGRAVEAVLEAYRKSGFPNQDFAVYGVDADRIMRVRETMREWSRQLEEEISGPEATGESGGRPPPVDPAHEVREGEQRGVARRSSLRSYGPSSDPGGADRFREDPGIDL
jgi:nucleotidyltransferase AbiEii toxin of type IV toxin-antitoxin system